MPVAGNGPDDPLLELLDALPDAAIVTEQAAPHRIVWVGAGYRELTGSDPSSAYGRPLGELCTHESSTGAFERLVSAVSRGETADAHMRIRRLDGQVVGIAVRD